MKINQLELSNFCSHKDVTFDFSKYSLCLVNGKTRAGKSTLFDGIYWALFGETSKGSAAQDVISWNATDVTKAVLTLEHFGKEYRITRIRSKTATKNDLVVEMDGTEQRGKDITDTQKFISQLLGITQENFLQSSYFHQFADSTYFFLAKPKDRRDILETLADLSTPVKLQDAASARKKDIRKEFDKLTDSQKKVSAAIEEKTKLFQSLEKQREQFLEKLATQKKDLENKRDNFEELKKQKLYKLVDQLAFLDKDIAEPAELKSHTASYKQQIDTIVQVKKDRDALAEARSGEQTEVRIRRAELTKLSSLKDSCPTCLSPIDSDTHKANLQELEKTIFNLEVLINQKDQAIKNIDDILAPEKKLTAAYTEAKLREINNDKLIEQAKAKRVEIEAAKLERNHYDEQLQALDMVPPQDEAMEQLTNELSKCIDEENTLLDKIAVLENEIINLEWLGDASLSLRAKLLNNVLSFMEERTNSLLREYYEGFLQISLEFEDEDKVKTTVYNNGNVTTFKQLSGGERRTLSLCFGIAMMQQVQNKIGFSISPVLFDEALNGLDNQLKVSSYQLLSLMSKDQSVYVIDHSEELKQMFDEQVQVIKRGNDTILE